MARLHIVRDEGRSLEEYKKLLSTKSIEPLQTFTIELGTQILLADGAKVKKDKIAEWEQHNIPIICDRPGYVKYEDLVEGISTQREVNKQTGQTELIVKQHRGELHPQIVIYADKEYARTRRNLCDSVRRYYLCCKKDNMSTAGKLLARLPRGAIKTKDITGGLPRVAELFEARKPKDAAEIAKIDGVVDFRGVQKNKRIVVVRDEESGMEEEHLIPHTKHLIVQRGDHVVKGQQLTDGLVDSARDPRNLRRPRTAKVSREPGARGLSPAGCGHQRQAHRDHRPPDASRKCASPIQAIRASSMAKRSTRRNLSTRTAKSPKRAAKPAQAAPVLLGITKASLEHRIVHLGGFLPRDNARPDRCCLCRQDRLPARLQRERHHGAHDPWRNRL